MKIHVYNYYRYGLFATIYYTGSNHFVVVWKNMNNSMVENDGLRRLNPILQNTFYAHDTQLYIFFQKQRHIWSIADKYAESFFYQLYFRNTSVDDQKQAKINDSKTEFIIFRSPQCKASISGVSVSMGDSNILPSPNVRDLGVIFLLMPYFRCSDNNDGMWI